MTQSDLNQRRARTDYEAQNSGKEFSSVNVGRLRKSNSKASKAKFWTRVKRNRLNIMKGLGVLTVVALFGLLGTGVTQINFAGSGRRGGQTREGDGVRSWKKQLVMGE